MDRGEVSRAPLTWCQKKNEPKFLSEAKKSERRGGTKKEAAGK